MFQNISQRKTDIMRLFPVIGRVGSHGIEFKAFFIHGYESH